MAQNKRKKKSMQTALYGKIKYRRGEWLIGANTQNVFYLSIVATQHKTRQRRVRRLLIRRVLMMAKADSFQDKIHPLYSCGLDIESTKHFLLHCPRFDKNVTFWKF